jgi:thioredoxin
MKKIISKFIFISVLFFALIISSCGNSNEEKTKPDDKKVIENNNNVENNANNENNNNTENVTPPPTVGKVIVLTDATFKEKVFDYKTQKEWSYKGTIPCVIDFYADWCGPCKMISPIMEELAAEYSGKIYFYKVNVDNEQALAQSFNISSIPAVLFVPLKGEPQMSVGAMQKEGYLDAISSVFGIK